MTTLPPNTLIGLIWLRETDHPEWLDTFDADPQSNVRGVPRTARLPFLHVGGVLFADFAGAAVVRARAEGMTWERGAWPSPEDSFLTLRPDHQAESWSRGRMLMAVCPCGDAGCGSVSARMTPATHQGVRGVLLDSFITRLNEDSTLPVPPIFIPLSAWPSGPDTLYQRLRAYQDALPADRDAMLRDAKQAARGLPDPWGRTLDTRGWLRRQRAEQGRRRAEAQRPPTAESLQAQHDRAMHHLARAEDAARAGRHPQETHGSPLPGRDAAWTAQRLEEMGAQRRDAEATLARELAEAEMSSRERRLSRRAARRAEKLALQARGFSSPGEALRALMRQNRAQLPTGADTPE